MSIGERLREERLRLGLNQTEFAALADSSKRVQVKWEKDESAPGAAALAAFAKAGADLIYVLTGERTGPRSKFEIVQDYEQRLDQIEKWLEMYAMTHMGKREASPEYASTRDQARNELVKIATSATTDVAATYQQRADDLLRNHFDDEEAAKRRQARFSERNRLVERVGTQLEDILAGLSLDISSGGEQALLNLMLNYRINPNDLVPLLSEWHKDITSQ